MRLRITAAVAAGLIVIALIGVYLATRQGPVGSVPAGPATPQAMPSGNQDLKAGTYAFDYPLLDAPGKPFPKLEITVPDGWAISGGFWLSSPSGTLTIWEVVDVYADGCHWSGPVIHPGPTADELAAVLASRPLRNATAPVAISLGGYHGNYLEWSVPVDANFSACDGGHFKSWYGAIQGLAKDLANGDANQQFPGQVDWLWILDVEGHRLLIDASSWPTTTVQDRVALANVVNSIAFKADSRE